MNSAESQKVEEKRNKVAGHMKEVFKGKGNAGKETAVTKKPKKCPHNRRRCECKLCGGASICEHKRIRSKCVECRGSSICEHNRRRIACKVYISLFLTLLHSVGSLSLSSLSRS
jgi:hypothetical protein